MDIFIYYAPISDFGLSEIKSNFAFVLVRDLGSLLLLS